jgi:hypothetical protein
MDQQVSDRHLQKISCVCCKDWRSLPAHLQLETIVAEDIDRSPKGEEEKRYDFLKKWKKIQGSGATYTKLHDALLAIKSKDDADRVCVIMQEVSSSSEASAESNSALAMLPTNPTCELAQEDALTTKSTEPVGETTPTDPLATKPGITDESPPTNTDSDTASPSMKREGGS